MTTMADNRTLVAEAFAAWEQGDSGPFFALVADDVTWTVIGSTEVSGTFTSKAAFTEGALRPLGAVLGPIEAEVRQVLADGDHVVLRWVGQATTKYGRDYAQTYCWVMRLAEGKVVEVTAYLDTELLTAVLSDRPS